MRFLTASLLLIALLLSACSDSNDEEPAATTGVSATSTQSAATVAAENTATPAASSQPPASVTPAPTTTPVQAIDADNFESMKAVSEVTVGEAQFLAWQDQIWMTGRGAVRARRPDFRTLTLHDDAQFCKK